MTERALLAGILTVNLIVGIAVGVFQFLQLRVLRQIRDKK